MRELEKKINATFWTEDGVKSAGVQLAGVVEAAGRVSRAGVESARVELSYHRQIEGLA